MPDNRRIQRNGDSSSNPSVHNIEEAVKRLKIQADGKEDGTVAGGYPGRPSEPDCIFYIRTGMCGYGSNCRFNHPTNIGQAIQHGGKLPERVGEPDCVYFLKTGTCKYGSTCKYNHPHDKRVAGPIMLNMVGLPMRQEEKACTHYIRTGSCKFGVSCKFNHPQPSVNGGVIPYASTIVPSSGIAAWSLPRPSYGSDPQTYLPVLLPPSQGIGSTQGWSTYMGIMSPVTPAGFLGDSGSIDQTISLKSTANLPERPGEPKCRYFMNTGNCKYGSDCKYHHPKEKTAQTVASSLGPLGLPLRPVSYLKYRHRQISFENYKNVRTKELILALGSIKERFSSHVYTSSFTCEIILVTMNRLSLNHYFLYLRAHKYSFAQCFCGYHLNEPHLVLAKRGTSHMGQPSQMCSKSSKLYILYIGSKLFHS